MSIHSYRPIDSRRRSAFDWKKARRLVLQCVSFVVLGLAESTSIGAAEPERESILPPQRQGFSPAVWTLEQVESAALEGNPTLSEMQARVEVARARWTQVGLPANPSIGYSGQQLSSRGLAEQDGVMVQMEFVRRQKRQLNRAVVAEEISIAEQNLAAQELRILTDARVGFYDALAAQRRVELNEELVAIGQQAVKTAERLLNAKEVSRIDLLQARVEADQARILLDNARQRSRAVWRSLAAIIGQPQVAERALQGSLTELACDYEWDESLARLLGASPEIAAASANIERARQALARARVETKPNLTVQGIVQHDNAVHFHNGAVQVSLPIPILNRNQGAIRAAEREWFAAEQNFRRAELDLQRRLSSVYERYAAARQQATRYADEILPNAQESLELSQAAYRAGEIGFIPLLTAQRTFSQTNLAYVEALRELWAASLEIEGLLLTGCLEERK